MVNFLFYLPCGGEINFREKCVEFISPANGDSILDVCCGTGELTSRIAGHEFIEQLVGVDISEPALKVSREKTRHTSASFLNASADNLPFSSSRFNKCLVSLGLHHMSGKERQAALKEIRRVLTLKGSLYVIEYNLPKSRLRRLIATAYAKIDQSKEAYEMLKDESLVKEIKQAGFEIKRQCFTCQGIIQLLEAARK